MPVLLALGCSGGGGGSGGDSSTASGFLVQSVGAGNTVLDGNVAWKINRQILITFTRPIDFDSVTPDTVNFKQLGGMPAVGSYYQVDARTIAFQPRCPVRDDFSDSGFLPNTNYMLQIAGGAQGGSSVIAADGRPLAQARTVFFKTVAATDPDLLFSDPQPGAPRPRIWPGGEVRKEGYSYVELGGDPTDRVYFEFNSQTGQGLLPAAFQLPINLYSDAKSRVAYVLEMDQPVNPSSTNVNNNRIRLEFQTLSGSWRGFPANVQIEANCVPTPVTAVGARIRITPRGILPQSRMFRLRIQNDFTDLTGDTNALDLTNFAMGMVGFTADSGGLPTSTSEEFREEFLASGTQLGSDEDTTSVMEVPRAKWGGGALSAAFGFSGTGGPGGDFDWYVAPGQSVTLDTTTDTITGGPGGIPVATQVVSHGIVNIRDLLVPEGSQIVINGPNPAVFQASGTVRINGRIICNGNNNGGVVTLNTINQPEDGSTGQGGGGRGGTASYLTQQGTPQGGPGAGAFDVAGQGGGGGDASYSTANDTNRRAGGGGGGRFGADQLKDDANFSFPGVCPNQNFIGLDVEAGFDGGTQGFSAITGTSPPRGGAAGPGPFIDSNPNNNFYGTMIRNVAFDPPTGGNPAPQQELVVGELEKPWAGAGGGGGGDAYDYATWPPSPLIPNQTDKGSGGGGGAGSLTILALGDIIIGPSGSIRANGGTGGGGENTNGVNRIGGGSGGGSGGHIILQTSGRIDLSQIVIPTVAGGQRRPKAAIQAMGGQGGAGKDERGGATAGGIQTSPCRDSIHGGTCPHLNYDGNGGPGTCQAVTQPNNFTDITCAGGDGGPGIVQFHVPDLASVIGPENNISLLRYACYPKPIGYQTIPVTQTPRFFHQLIPQFGRFSRAQSKWIDLGGVHVDPTSDAPRQVQFFFDGTDPATGVVDRDGVEVAALDPIVGPAGVGSASFPAFDAAKRALTVDLSGLSGDDDIYRRNPLLLLHFTIQEVSGLYELEVVKAAVDPTDSDRAILTLASGPAPTGTFSLVPNFFRVVTNGTPDSMPASSKVIIQFQATKTSSTGTPDLGAIFPSSGTWTSDITTLNALPNNLDYQFVRFRVTFDVRADGGQLTFDTPIPSVDFLRVPMRF